MTYHIVKTQHEWKAVEPDGWVLASVSRLHHGLLGETDTINSGWHDGTEKGRIAWNFMADLLDRDLVLHEARIN